MQRAGHLTANGHPRNAAPQWVWTTASHVALKHKEEKRGTLSAFLFIVGQQRVGSTRRGRLILHALSLSSSL